MSAFFLTEKGRATLRGWLTMLEGAPQRLDEWNDAANAELDRIQATLNQIAQTLEPRTQAGR